MIIESEKIAHAFLSATTDGAILIDTEGTVIDINETMAGYMNKSVSELINTCIFDFLPPETIQHRKAMTEKVVRSGKPVRFEEKGSRNKWFDSSLCPVLDRCGKVTHIAVFSHDITGRRRAEEALRKSERDIRVFSRKILSVREEEKKKMAKNLHDEVGSMVVALGSCLSVAEGEIKDNNLQGALKSIRQTRSKLRKAVKNLKSIAVDLRPVSLDVIGLTSALREYFSDVSKQTKIMIDFSVNIDEKGIDGDAGTVLYRVAQEALTNIIRHSRAKRVKITLSDDSSGTKLNVHDDGKGFDIEKISREIKGLGIRGMRESVESLDGRFVIESSPEKGTEISVTLPDKS